MSKYFPIVMSLYDLVLFNTHNSYLTKSYIGNANPGKLLTLSSKAF